MAENKTTMELEHSASEKSGFFSVRGQSHSGSVSQEPDDYQYVSSKDESSVMRRWNKETHIADLLCESQCESASITDMCSICAAKGIGKIATHICRDCSQYGRYYCQSCWDYHNKFLPIHDTLSLSVCSDRECGTDKKVKVVRRTQSNDSSISRRRGTERNRTKAETPRESSSVREGNDYDECRIEIEKLNEKLEIACKNNYIREYTYATYSYVRTKKKNSPLKQQFQRVNEQVDRIITHLEMTRGMSSVKGKAKFKLVQNVTENVQREAKARMKKVTTCLEKLKVQIDANKFVALEFQKLGGSHDEKQIKSCLEDICMKVKNIHDTGKWLNDIQKILKTEISSLKNEISHFWDTDEPAIDYVQGNHPKLVKDILDARHMLNQKKKEVAKEASKRESDGRETKLQQHVDELWKLAFDSENNKTGSNSDEGNLLNMLEKITPEIKKLKNLQATMEMEIKALNDDVAKYNDQIEPSIINVCSEHPRIINDTLNTRKQLSSKTIDVTIQIKDSEEDRNKGISTLKQHVITLWQLATETEKLPDNDDHDSVSNLVKLLTDIKLQMKYERNKQEEARKEKQSQEHAIKYLWERIYPGKVISGEDVATLLVDIENYATDTQKKLEDFDRIEDLALKVEEQAHRMYLELTCSKHSYTDDSQTANGILKRSLEILQSCFSETKASVIEINTLEEVLRSHSNSTSISNRCNLATQKAKGWMEIHEKTKRFLDQSVETLTVSYTQLLGEPYHFNESNRIKESVIGRLPDWLQNIKDAVIVLHACIENNKDSFQQRFVSQERLNEERGKLHGQIKQLQAEKDECFKRLSRMMGNKLGDNNPDLADLSDKIRPTKIADKYTELFDNEWTDAFEVYQTESATEKQTIETLLQILQDAKEACDTFAKEQAQKLKEAVKMNQATEHLPDLTIKHMKDFRKFTADESLPGVLEKCLNAVCNKSYVRLLRHRDVLPFFKGCVELCWFMNVQDPPLAFGDTPTRNQPFDNNIFRFYTAKGSYFDFMVWPVLHLTKDGAFLTKGVAQACSGHQPEWESNENRQAKSSRNKEISYPFVYSRQVVSPAQNVDPHRIQSNHDNKKSSSNQLMQNVQNKNYEQFVVDKSDHTSDKTKLFSQTVKQHVSASVATLAQRLTRNSSSSPRHFTLDTYIKQDLKPSMPVLNVWSKFKGLIKFNDINGQEMRKCMGKDYESCIAYYNYLYGKTSTESDV